MRKIYSLLHSIPCDNYYIAKNKHITNFCVAEKDINDSTLLRESVAYPVLITAATPPPTPRNLAGGWARMGGSKGCFKISRVSVLIIGKLQK